MNTHKMKDEDKLIAKYFEQTKEYVQLYGEQTIVLIQVGQFYECYGIESEDGIITGSKLQEFSDMFELKIGKATTKLFNNKAKMTGFNVVTLDKYVYKLQNHGFTVVVIEQTKIAPRVFVRDKVNIFSPGTYFSDKPTSTSTSSSLTNNTCCFWIELSTNKESLYVGMSQIDIITGKTSLSQYDILYMNNPSTYDELECFVSIYKPSECIIITNLSKDIINNVVSFINLDECCKLIHTVFLFDGSKEVVATGSNKERALNCEKQKYQFNILQKIYNIDDEYFMTFYMDHWIATQSFCYLLDFVYQHNPGLLTNISDPIFEYNENKLILANHS